MCACVVRAERGRERSSRCVPWLAAAPASRVPDCARCTATGLPLPAPPAVCSLPTESSLYMGAGLTKASPAVMSAAKSLVDSTINGNKVRSLNITHLRPAGTAANPRLRRSPPLSQVVVFSKTYCPYCTKAKRALQQFLDASKMTVIELDARRWAGPQDGNAPSPALLPNVTMRRNPQQARAGVFWATNEHAPEPPTTQSSVLPPLQRRLRGARLSGAADGRALCAPRVH